MAKLTGGDAFCERLDQISEGVTKGGKLSVGWPEDSTYSDGTLVGMVAAIQEFGAQITIPEHDTTLYRMLNKAQTEFLRGGKFVKKSKANWSETATVGEYNVNIPPRPFLRNAIRENSPDWADQIANLLQSNNYNAKRVLRLMGPEIVGQVQDSIDKLMDPPNAPSTVRKKGFDNPLIESGKMKNTVSYEVEGD